MDNPFVAALLMTAAEHRLRAESRRCMIDRAPERTRGALGNWWRELLAKMNRELQAEVDHHEGLADVYESFARKILGEDYWVRWNWVTKDSYLMGPISLLDPKFEPEAFQVAGQHDVPADWWRRYSWFLPGPIGRLPITVTGV